MKTILPLLTFINILALNNAFSGQKTFKQVFTQETLENLDHITIGFTHSWALYDKDAPALPPIVKEIRTLNSNGFSQEGNFHQHPLVLILTSNEMNQMADRWTKDDSEAQEDSITEVAGGYRRFTREISSHTVSDSELPLEYKSEEYKCRTGPLNPRNFQLSTTRLSDVNGFHTYCIINETSDYHCRSVVTWVWTGGSHGSNGKQGYILQGDKANEPFIKALQPLWVQGVHNNSDQNGTHSEWSRASCTVEDSDLPSECQTIELRAQNAALKVRGKPFVKKRIFFYYPPDSMGREGYGERFEPLKDENNWKKVDPKIIPKNAVWIDHPSFNTRYCVVDEVDMPPEEQSPEIRALIAKEAAIEVALTEQKKHQNEIDANLATTKNENQAEIEKIKKQANEKLELAQKESNDEKEALERENELLKAALRALSTQAGIPLPEGF